MESIHPLSLSRARARALSLSLSLSHTHTGYTAEGVDFYGSTLLPLNSDASTGLFCHMNRSLLPYE